MSEPVVTLDRLTKRYGDRTAVDDVSLRLDEGVVCGLLGPNGSGKTTAMRCLLGLARATSGETTVLGHTPGSPGFRAALKRVGCLIEQPAIYRQATARQNLELRALALGIERDDPLVTRTLDHVGLSGRGEDRVKGFSLGMKQRLGLAMALIGEPRLVVLDEPTNGLDPEGIVEIRELVRSLPAQGISVFVSSHLLAETEIMCSEVAVLRHGQLLRHASMTELLGGGGARVDVAVDPDELPRALEILDGLGAGAERLDARTVAVYGLGGGREAVAALAAAGIHPDEVRRYETTLEEAFLELTREQDAGAGA